MEPIRKLAQAFRDGDLAAAELAELCERLRVDDASVDDFVLECMLVDELRQCLSEYSPVESSAAKQLQVVCDAKPSTTLSPDSNSVWRAWSASVWNWFAHPTALSMLVSGVVMTVILVALAMWTVPHWRPASVGDGPGFVARITDSLEATWDATSDGNLAKHDLDIGDRLVLQSGSVVVTHGAGAHVVLEGPATYAIQGPNSGDLQQGKLVARAEAIEALGFAVDIPGAQVVDLGTEFGIEVAASGAADVAVLTGTVDLLGKSKAAGPKQSVRLTANEGATVEAVSGKIVRRAKADGQLLADMRGRLDRFEGSRATPNRENGGVLAHYGLEETLAANSIAQGLTASNIRMAVGGYSHLGEVPEGAHERFILDVDTGSANPPTIADIKAAWTLTPEPGARISLNAVDSVTWRLRLYSHGPIEFYSKIFVSSDPSFSTVLAESSVFSVVNDGKDRLSQPVGASLNAPVAHTGPLYFGLAFTDTGLTGESANGRFDAIYVNGKVSSAATDDSK
jgi:hypothetical protein